MHKIAFLHANIYNFARHWSSNWSTYTFFCFWIADNVLSCRKMITTHYFNFHKIMLQKSMSLLYLLSTILSMATARNTQKNNAGITMSNISHQNTTLKWERRWKNKDTTTTDIFLCTSWQNNATLVFQAQDIYPAAGFDISDSKLFMTWRFTPIYIQSLSHWTQNWTH